MAAWSPKLLSDSAPHTQTGGCQGEPTRNSHSNRVVRELHASGGLNHHHYYYFPWTAVKCFSLGSNIVHIMLNSISVWSFSSDRYYHLLYCSLYFLIDIVLRLSFAVGIFLLFSLPMLCYIISGPFDPSVFPKTYERRSYVSSVGTHSPRQCRSSLWEPPLDPNCLVSSWSSDIHHCSMYTTATLLYQGPQWILAAWSTADFSAVLVRHLETSHFITGLGGS